MKKFKIIFNIAIIDYFKLDFEELVKIYNNKIKICNYKFLFCYYKPCGF